MFLFLFFPSGGVVVINSKSLFRESRIFRRKLGSLFKELVRYFFKFFKLNPLLTLVRNFISKIRNLEDRVRHWLRS